MTGYGKVCSEFQNKKIVIEIKSLNSKQTDIVSRISGVYRDREIEFRNLIASNLVRGKIDFSLYVEDAGVGSMASINTSAVKAYYEQMKSTCEALSLPMPENAMQIIMGLPEILLTETVEVSEEEMAIVDELLVKAFEEIKSFRIQEGRVLQGVFAEKIESIANLVEQVAPFEAERLEKIRTRLEENLQTIDERFKIDQNRLEQELIFYIEKLDINEEKVRLRNHLKYFIETMENEEAAGKKLGFIVQEIGREINTLGSKSNHAEMQKIVVKMKDELEQIKEQVLNVL